MKGEEELEKHMRFPATERVKFMRKRRLRKNKLPDLGCKLK